MRRCASMGWLTAAMVALAVGGNRLGAMCVKECWNIEAWTRVWNDPNGWCFVVFDKTSGDKSVICSRAIAGNMWVGPSHGNVPCDPNIVGKITVYGCPMMRCKELCNPAKTPRQVEYLHELPQEDCMKGGDRDRKYCKTSP